MTCCRSCAVSRVSLRQRLRIFARGPLLCLLSCFPEILLQFRRQLVVIARNHGEAWNQQDVRLVVGLRVFERLEIDRDRKQGDSVERYSLPSELSGDARRTGGAITFSEQEQRRTPALVAADIHANEFAEGLHVAFYAPELFGELGRFRHGCSRYRLHRRERDHSYRVACWRCLRCDRGLAEAIRRDAAQPGADRALPYATRSRQNPGRR